MASTIRRRVQPAALWLGNRLLVCDGLPGDQQCTAKTIKGKRCQLPIEYGQITGAVQVHVPGGVVTAHHHHDGFKDLDRWEAQRCDRHWPDGQPATDPEWENFDPDIHRALVSPPLYDVLTWSRGDGISSATALLTVTDADCGRQE